MSPNEITPVILTYNEAPNIGRTLRNLSWAADVVVVDSLSADNTVDIAGSFPNVRVFQRPFDNHATQWNFAISETGIGTPWILALDADYGVPEKFAEEVAALGHDPTVVGYRANFNYAIFGKLLRGATYPPVTVLFRKGSGEYVQDGHTQRWKGNGQVRDLAGTFTHDDRKTLHQWVLSQDRYMKLEVEKLGSIPKSELNFPDRLRLVPFLTPFLMFFYCLLVKGNVLDGKAGFYYAGQRAFAEMLLSLYLMEQAIKGSR